MIAFLRRLATPRTLFIAFLVVVILMALIDLIAVPAFRRVASGFVPFNLQNPLSAVMVAFERGALGPGTASRYFRFAALQGLYGLVYAWFTILLWCWLSARSPHTLADRVMTYGVLALPVLGAVLGMVESVLFMKLIVANPRDPQHDLTVTALAIHRAKFVIDTLTYAFTAAFIVTAIAGKLMRRKAESA